MGYFISSHKLEIYVCIFSRVFGMYLVKSQVIMYKKKLGIDIVLLYGWMKRIDYFVKPHSQPSSLTNSDTSLEQNKRRDESSSCINRRSRSNRVNDEFFIDSLTDTTLLIITLENNQ